MTTNTNFGFLSICCGCMFSGKTSWLMQEYKKYSYIGKSIAVVNYADDTRYHETMLSTHDKHMIPCIQAKTLDCIKEQIERADVILINEGQFFPDLYDAVTHLVEVQCKIVYIAALDGDFKRKTFGQVLELLPRCDDYIKLHALCATCKDGTRAPFSHRISTESDQISIGADNYVPLCRSCYTKENSTVAHIVEYENV